VSNHPVFPKGVESKPPTEGSSGSVKKSSRRSLKKRSEPSAAVLEPVGASDAFFTFAQAEAIANQCHHALWTRAFSIAMDEFGETIDQWRGGGESNSLRKIAS
jgi:hypothetical protein